MNALASGERVYNARMGLMRRLFTAFLLFCVVLALGDAPYVDEFLDDLAAARTASIEPSPVEAHHRNAPSSPTGKAGSSRIYQNLLNLSAAPRPVEVPAVDGSHPRSDTFHASFSSAPLRRIDRPPAPLIA